MHITKPWKTFRNVQPPNYILQNILQYRFDQGSYRRQRRDSDHLVHGSGERNVAVQVRGRESFTLVIRTNWFPVRAFLVAIFGIV